MVQLSKRLLNQNRAHLGVGAISPRGSPTIRNHLGIRNNLPRHWLSFFRSSDRNIYVGYESICALGIPKINSFFISLIFKISNRRGESDGFCTKLKWVPDPPFSPTFYGKKFQTPKS